MKKLVTTLIATGMLVGMGSVFAQNNFATHDLDVRIPEVLALRITVGSGNTSASNPSVRFDFTSGDGFDDYLAAIEAGSGALDPTLVTNFGNVVVIANRGTWRVRVSANAFGFVATTVPAELPAGVALADIVVTPTGAINTTFVTLRATSWDLTTATDIASGIRTEGWRNLGISGDDYAFNANGDEAPGTYTTVVTYTITAP